MRQHWRSGNPSGDPICPAPGAASPPPCSSRNDAACTTFSAAAPASPKPSICTRSAAGRRSRRRNCQTGSAAPARSAWYPGAAGRGTAPSPASRGRPAPRPGGQQRARIRARWPSAPGGRFAGAAGSSGPACPPAPARSRRLILRAMFPRAELPAGRIRRESLPISTTKGGLSRPAGDNVKISQPVSVTPTMCSNCADRLRSRSPRSSRHRAPSPPGGRRSPSARS